jgi:hypothetical protein
LDWWKNYFSQLLNVYWVNDIWKTEIHTAKPLVIRPSACEFELVIEELTGHKSPGIVQIPSELVKAGGRSIRYEINKFIISIWSKENLSEEWKVSIIIRSTYL